METIAQIVDRFTVNDPVGLVTALLQREDEIADNLRQAGALFGLYPEIVAEVLTNAINLGTPVPDEVHRHVHQQFVALITRLNNQQG